MDYYSKTCPVLSPKKKTFESVKLRADLARVWKQLSTSPECYPFKLPVDPRTLGCLDYFDIIKKPMDMSTIRAKIPKYKNPKDFCDDFWLMIENAWLYNRTNSYIYKAASKFENTFTTLMDPIMKEYGYCCSQNYVHCLIELSCHNNKNCGIKPGQEYYVYEELSESSTVSQKYMYCLKCFNSFPDDRVSLTILDAVEGVFVPKSKFKLQVDERCEREPTDFCIMCDREWHRICAGHHEQIHRGFICPTCRDERDLPLAPNPYSAKNLPTSYLSRHIEKRVNQLIKKQPNGRGIGPVIIRVLSNIKKKSEAQPWMKERICSSQGFPETFPYRGKSIFAFQEVDGTEICIFGMHVQEYGSDCQEPNQKHVYISYLDSVSLFEPKYLRTELYHEIVLGYFDFVRNLGYKWCQIWACPPCDGDDYIFFCHPPEQKVPRLRRLQEWYFKMFRKGQKEGVILQFNNIINKVKGKSVFGPTDLPYFDGDLWPRLIEEAFNPENKSLLVKNRSNNHLEEVKRQQLLEEGYQPKRKKFKPDCSDVANASPQNDDELANKSLLTALKSYKELFFVRFKVSREMSDVDVVDPDPVLPVQLMDGRDPFLLRSRQERWEFNSVRRAKYSTMCFCYVLHKPEYRCSKCQKRSYWRCVVCKDFYLCSACHLNEKHEHQMCQVEIGDYENNIVTKRTFAMMNPVFLLEHCRACKEPDCTRAKCGEMKDMLRLSETCPVVPIEDCEICCYLREVLNTHFEYCKDARCPANGFVEDVPESPQFEFIDDIVIEEVVRQKPKKSTSRRSVAKISPTSSATREARRKRASPVNVPTCRKRKPAARQKSRSLSPVPEFNPSPDDPYDYDADDHYFDNKEIEMPFENMEQFDECFTALPVGEKRFVLDNMMHAANIMFGEFRRLNGQLRALNARSGRINKQVQREVEAAASGSDPRLVPRSSKNLNTSVVEAVLNLDEEETEKILSKKKLTPSMRALLKSRREEDHTSFQQG